MLVFIEEENGKAIDKKQLNVYETCAAQIIYERDYKQSALDFIIEYITKNENDSILFVSEGSIIAESEIKQMIEIQEASYHNAFVCRDFFSNDCQLKDSLRGDVILFSTRFMNMFAAKFPQNKPIKAWLEEVYQLIRTAGFSAVGFELKDKEKYINNLEIIKYMRKPHKKRIIMFIQGLPLWTNGSVVHNLGILEGLYRNYSPEYAVTVYCDVDFKNKYFLEKTYKEIEYISSYEELEYYDIAINAVPDLRLNINFQKMLVEHCAFWITWNLDNISLRNSINDLYLSRCRKNLIALSDRILTFSYDVKNDTEMIFKDIELSIDVINIPGTLYDEKNIGDCAELCPFADFYLVMGNTFKHKMIEPCVEYLKVCNRNFIVVGSKKEGFFSENIYTYVSGFLTDEYINFLFAKCKGVIFPSLYEGFGLPVIQALNFGKHVIVCDTPINHELESLGNDFYKAIHYIKSYKEIALMISEIENGQETIAFNQYNVTWNDVGKQIIAICNDITENNVYSPFFPDRIENILENNVDLALHEKNDVLMPRQNYAMKIMNEFEKLLVFGGDFDIYGFGLNGRLLALLLLTSGKISSFINGKVVNEAEWRNIPIVSMDNYNYQKNNYVIITPLYDEEIIKSKLINEKGVPEDHILELRDIM